MGNKRISKTFICTFMSLVLVVGLCPAPASASEVAPTASAEAETATTATTAATTASTAPVDKTGIAWLNKNSYKTIDAWIDMMKSDTTTKIKLGGNPEMTMAAYMKKRQDEGTLDEWLADLGSVDTIRKDIASIKECNKLRAGDGNFGPLTPLKVSPVLMAFSAASSVASATFSVTYNGTQHVLFASNYFKWSGGENLAWGYTDPFTGWYTAEKKIYDSGDTDYNKTGHYQNIVGGWSVTGFAWNGSTTEQCFSGDYFAQENDPDVVSLSTYSNNFEAFVKNYSLDSATVTAPNASAYTGSAITPTPTVALAGKTLVAGTDYKVTYANNVNPGSATVYVEGIGDYTGVGSATFTIPAPAKGASFMVGPATYKVTSAGKVSLTKVSTTKSSFSVPTTLSLGSATFKVTRIAAKAFSGNTTLKKVTIGKNVQVIGAKAFYGCRHLTKLVVKSSKLKSVGSKAFKGVPAKVKVYVPKAKTAKYGKLLHKAGLSKKAVIKKV